MARDILKPVRGRGNGIPFISDWSNLGRPLEGNGPLNSVDDPAQTLAAWRDERKLEARVGDWNTVPASLLEVLAKSRRAVAKIVVSGATNHQGDFGDWFGTGFLVAPNLLLTNHHVLNNETVAAGATVLFDFEWPADQLSTQLGQPPSVTFSLDPTRLFLTSPAQGGLDYTFVWIDAAAGERFGTVPMRRSSFSIGIGEPVFAIHHPLGETKQVSLDDTELLGINDDCLLYAADTNKGSSGACVFNRDGRLIALHHATIAAADIKPLYPGASDILSDQRRYEFANEGIKIAAIGVDVEARVTKGGTDATKAAEVLSMFQGSDTLTGIFGVMGRSSDATHDHERMLALYRRDEQDIDLGFWHMGWMRSDDRKLIERAALALFDVKLDLWCIDQISQVRTKALVERLKSRFNEEFGDLRLDEGAPGVDGGVSAIWRSKALRAERGQWPANLAAWFTTPVPGLGQVMARPPTWLRVLTLDGQLVSNVISISPRETDDLRLVSRMAAAAVERMADLAEGGGDWIIAGGRQPLISMDDLAGLKRRGYGVATAQSIHGGPALICLRKPDSRVMRGFVTQDLEPRDDPAKLLTRAEDRSLHRIFAPLSESQPTALRLTLRDGTAAQDPMELLDRHIGLIGTPQVEAAQGLRFAGLDKPGFLRANRAILARMIADASRGMASPVTELDLWAIVFAEAGLRNGMVDPDARHSLGERGLLPLPDNIASWIGPGAPAWDQPMPPERNISAYLGYLAAIRNQPRSTVAGLQLYRDLFRMQPIATQPRRAALLLAGIIHGYFSASNYRDRRVPFQHIMQGYVADQPVQEILRGTGYVHEGGTILINRQANLDAGLAALAASGP